MSEFAQNPFAALQKSSLAALSGFGQAYFNSWQRVAQLNLQTMKEALESGSEHVSKLCTQRDLREVLAAQGGASQPTAEKAIAYVQDLYEIFTETQAEFARIAEAQCGHYHSSLGAFVDEFAKHAPAGSEVVTAVLKSAVTAANGTYDTLSKATKQASEVVLSNVEASGSMVLKQPPKTKAA
ncbi:phasin family protein [Cupriavidus basilensis]|uniref:phasin family protein n=1 Tax=Cupriavidus basilensis TaxID=68895 RepID=UPI0023E7DBCD|nr:phasin family protein [Cupriavidus basilensis]MDF3881234.1 phasin family protein [Cupriavidus basilensis]